MSQRTSPAKPHLLARRWRVLLAGAAGVATLFAARSEALPRDLSSLVAWNAANIVYLVTTLRMVWRDDEARVRRRASYEDEGQSVTSAIVLSAVAAGLAATVFALKESKAASAHVSHAPPWAWMFSVSTLVLGWLVVQLVFTLHYAHRYFGDGNKDGSIDGGVKFPGDPPTTYHDFIYMAVCIGASAQVSDFNITSSRFRRLVTFHSLVAFFFNTMVLALGINIIATVIGQ
jgi:uncharacterized membrane protein